MNHDAILTLQLHLPESKARLGAINSVMQKRNERAFKETDREYTVLPFASWAQLGILESTQLMVAECQRKMEKTLETSIT